MPETNGTFTDGTGVSFLTVPKIIKDIIPSDIREVIYTADGDTVLRYDREWGITSVSRPGEADGSHLK